MIQRWLRNILVSGVIAVALAGAVAVPASGSPGIRAQAQTAGCDAAQIAPSALQPITGSTAVLFVHGFVSSPGIWAQGPGPTLPVQTAALPGLTAWTFDYSAVAANWVTDPQIGPALASTISCLAAATGGPVVIVAHSMGGLATQLAVSETGPDGAPVGSHVAEVITVGTPFQGSVFEALSAMSVSSLEGSVTSDGSQGKSAQLVALLEAMRSVCAGSIVHDPQVDPCHDLALNLTPAGQALQAGSPQLAALPPWPSSLPVYNTAGNINETLHFGIAFFSVDIGDLPVDLASATAHTTVDKPFVASSCDDVNFLRLMTFSETVPCYHHNLPYNPEIDAAVMARLRRFSHSKPAGLIVQDEAAARVTLLPVTGDILGHPVLGPDGRVWYLTGDQFGADTMVHAVDPRTMAEGSYRLTYRPATGKVAYSGELAFDGNGNLWIPAALIADRQPEIDVLLRYSTQSWAADKLDAPAKCQTGNGHPTEKVTEATDGAVWVTCPSNDFGAPGGTYVERRAPDGTPTPSHVVLQGSPGDVLYIGSQQLPAQSLSAPMAPLPGGVMWNASNGDIVTFGADGSERLILPTTTGVAKPGSPATTGELELFANGSADTPTELSSCLVVETNQQTHTAECFVTVSPAGALKVLAVLPDDNGYNLRQAAAAAMDSAGTAWVMLKGTAAGKAPEGRYYIAVGPDGHPSIYPFTATGSSGDPVSPDLQAPVITADGGLWTSGSGGQTAYLMEVLPKR